MKKLLHLVIVLSLALSQACEGPAGEQGEPGPKGDTGAQGPAGPQGLPGTSATAQVFEFPWDFTAEDQYELGFEFAGLETPIEIGETDVIMTYMAYGTYKDTIIWAPLPQTFNSSLGQYKFNYAYNNLAMFIFIEGAANVLAGLTETELTGHGFRVVIIPGSPAGGRTAKADVNLNNYAEVAKYYNITDASVKRIQVKK